MNLAIIPARGGSKRIPRKNIKDFCGKPIIAYSIKAAQDSQIFDKIIVSTDSAEIAQVAVDFGAECPHLRESFCDDFATTLEVLAYESNRLNLQKNDCICCIYPTAPLLKVDFLKKGFEKFLQNQKSYIFSVCEYNANPLRSFFIKDDKIQMLAERFELVRSQDLEALYYDAGQFYFGSAENFLSKKPIFSEDSRIVKIPQIFVTDINTPDDWEIAELKYKILADSRKI